MRANRILTTNHFQGASIPQHPSGAIEEVRVEMKRYQKFFSPIILGLFVWAVGLRYCAVTEECVKPWPEIVEIVSDLLMLPPYIAPLHRHTNYFSAVSWP